MCPLKQSSAVLHDRPQVKKLAISQQKFIGTWLHLTHPCRTCIMGSHRSFQWLHYQTRRQIPLKWGPCCQSSRRWLGVNLSYFKSEADTTLLITNYMPYMYIRYVYTYIYYITLYVYYIILHNIHTYIYIHIHTYVCVYIYNIDSPIYIYIFNISVHA